MADANKMSLQHVAGKFYPDALVRYLQQPDAHFKWSAMPRFRLSEDQCRSLAHWLIARSDSKPFLTEPSTAEIVERGKKLVETSGCLNCHATGLTNRFKAATLAELKDINRAALRACG